jgi:hypothetical protein
MDSFGFDYLSDNGVCMKEFEINKEWDLMKPVGKEFEYELDKSTGEVVKKYVDMINNDGFKKVKALDYSPEFTYWFERIYCQSPRMASLEYDDEKMWEAWKAAKEYGIKEL